MDEQEQTTTQNIEAIDENQDIHKDHNKCEKCENCKDCKVCKCQCCDCENCNCANESNEGCSCCEDCKNGSCRVKKISDSSASADAVAASGNSLGKPLEKVMIICSKAGIDSVYAALILANGARSEGIECDMFFTFFGLDVITKKRMDHLKIAIAGNTGMHMPDMVGVLPGMDRFATHMMMKEMQKLDIPTVGEFLEIIKAAGGKLFGCKLAAEMFHLTREDMWEGIDDVLTVGQFYERATERSQIIFI